MGCKDPASLRYCTVTASHPLTIWCKESFTLGGVSPFGGIGSRDADAGEYLSRVANVLAVRWVKYLHYSSRTVSPLARGRAGLITLTSESIVGKYEHGPHCPLYIDASHPVQDHGGLTAPWKITSFLPMTLSPLSC